MKEISRLGPDTFIAHAGVNGWNGLFSVTARAKIAYVIEHFFSWVSSRTEKLTFYLRPINSQRRSNLLRNGVSREIPSYLQIFISEQIDVLPVKMFLYASEVIDHFLFFQYRCRGCRAYAQLMAKWMYLHLSIPAGNTNKQLNTMKIKCYAL